MLSDIKNKGLLRFLNTQTNQTINIFSQTSDVDLLSKIGIVACNEFRFDSFSSVNPIDVKSQLVDKFSAEQLLDHVNKMSINGLSCNGDEISLKECRASSIQYDSSMPLFELNVECSCKLKFIYSIFLKYLT